MTCAIVAFIWRKAGLSPSDFKLYYETNYMPFLLELMGPTFPLTHSRFYIERGLVNNSSSDATNASYAPVVYAGTPDDFDYDVFTQFIFESAAARQAFQARLQEPEVAGKIAEEEEKFIDLPKLKVAAVDGPMVTTRRPSQNSPSSQS
ncbi:MAG: hypothetical protein Q9181_005967 [Wetmoreana brouardii]